MTFTEVNTVEDLIRDRLARPGLGWRFLPGKDLDRELESLKSAARERLGRLFDPADYPPSLTGQFDLTWDFPSVEPPDYLQRLHPEIYREECRRAQARFEDAVRRRCHAGFVTGIVGKGCLLGLELTMPAKDLQKALLEHRIITGTSNDPAVLRLMPPLTVKESAVDDLAKVLGTIGAPHETLP